MELKRVWAMYFSPTGGTEKAVRTTAQVVAEKLNLPLEIYDFTLPQGREKDAVFGEGDLVVCGTPVIAGRVPNVLLPYLTEKVKGNGAYAVPVVSFGNRNYDDALIELRNILEQDGLSDGCRRCFCERAFLFQNPCGRQTRCKGFGKHAGIWRKIAEKLTSGWEYTAPAYVKGCDPIRPYFKPQDRHGAHIDIRKVKPKVSDACVGCGHCAEVCPMGSISRENIREYIGICIKCCACVKKCPVGARIF